MVGTGLGVERIKDGGEGEKMEERVRVMGWCAFMYMWCACVHMWCACDVHVVHMWVSLTWSDYCDRVLN